MKRIIVLLNVLVLSAVLMGCGKKEVEIGDLLTYTTSGLDGTGIVEQCISRNNLLMALIDAGKVNNELEAEIVTDLLLSESLDTSWEPKSDLKNGDSVTVSIVVDEDKFAEYGIKLTGDTEIQFDVAGLEEPIEVDLFEYFDENKAFRESDDIAPYIYLQSMLKGDLSMDTKFVTNFECDTDGRIFMNGDKVSYTAYYNKSYFESEKMVPKDGVTSKEIELTNLHTYVLSLDDMREDQVNSMKDFMTDCLEKHFKEKQFAYIPYFGEYSKNISSCELVEVIPLKYSICRQEEFTSEENRISFGASDTKCVISVLYEAKFKDSARPEGFSIYTGMNLSNAYIDGTNGNLVISPYYVFAIEDSLHFNEVARYLAYETLDELEAVVESNANSYFLNNCYYEIKEF